MFPSFATNVHNLPERDGERRHYNTSQRIFLCVCLEWFFLVLIMPFIKSHRVRNNNKILLNWTCHHDRRYNTPFKTQLSCHIPDWVDCPHFVHGLCFPVLAPPSPGHQLHWAGEILDYKLAMNFAFFSPSALKLWGLFRTPRDWTGFWKCTLKTIYQII